MSKKKRMRHRIFWYTLSIAAVFCAAIAAYLLVPVHIAPAKQIMWGTTFTKSYAEYLGLDWRKNYLALMDDLGMRAIRIGINWDEVEPVRGQFHFDDYDWMIAEAQSRGVEILPAVGFKLPRWPECRSPGWAMQLPEKAFEEAQLEMMRSVVVHFQGSPAIKMWQMENEAFIEWFGQCPRMSDALARRKVDLVRELDPSRPVLMTESGELSSWIKSAFSADMVGFSLYRKVWSQWQGYSDYHFAPSYYAHKAQLVRAIVPHPISFLITELQLEVWSPQGILMQSLDEQLKLVTPEYMRETFDFARQSGMSTIYTWGAEWWYWLREKGHPEYWEAVKDELAQDR